MNKCENELQSLQGKKIPLFLGVPAVNAILLSFDKNKCKCQAKPAMTSDFFENAMILSKEHLESRLND